MKYKVLIPVLCALLGACAVHTDLEPLGEKKVAVHAAYGGPIIKVFGVHMPMPYLTTGIAYGLNDKMNLSGDLHVTPAAYSVILVDPAVTWFPVLNHGLKPTVGLQGQLLFGMSVKAKVTGNNRFRAYPLLTPTAAWKLGPGTIYSGFNLISQFKRPDYDRDAPYVIWSPFAGYRWNLTKKLQLQLELKYHAALIQSNETAVTYNNWEKSNITYGAVTPMVGFGWSF